VESSQNKLQNEVWFHVLLSLCIFYNVLIMTAFLCTGNCRFFFGDNRLCTTNGYLGAECLEAMVSRVLLCLYPRIPQLFLRWLINFTHNIYIYYSYIEICCESTNFYFDFFGT
jgi:hypothetical protein